MAKTATINGIENASFGYYGGSNIKPKSLNAKGYEQVACIVCGDKAIYHTGGDGYCRGHREDAVRRRARGTKLQSESFLTRVEDRGDLVFEVPGCGIDILTILAEEGEKQMDAYRESVDD